MDDGLFNENWTQLKLLIFLTTKQEFWLQHAIRYNTTHYEILTCTEKRSVVSFIYHTYNQKSRN